MSNTEHQKLLAKRARRKNRQDKGKTRKPKPTGLSDRFCKMVANAASTLLKTRLSRKPKPRKYGQGYTPKPVPVEALGTVLKKRKGQIEAFRYKHLPNGQIAKVAA